MNSPEVLETLLLGKDEDHGVVTVSTTRMDWDGGGLVHDHQVIRHLDDPDPLIRDRDLVSENYK